MNDKPRYIIGIDPGEKTGLAVYNTERKRLQFILTSDFWRTYEIITSNFDERDTQVIIEDASLSNHTHRRKGNVRVQERLSRDVGKVQREGELLAIGLRNKGYKVHRIAPQGDKWTQGIFKRITKALETVDEHARDAARFCWGVNKWLPEN